MVCERGNHHYCRVTLIEASAFCGINESGMFAGFEFGVPCLSQRRLSERLFRPLALVRCACFATVGSLGGSCAHDKTHNLFTLMCVARNRATPVTHGKRGKADHKYCRLIVICNVSISTSREWAIYRRDGVLVPWKSLRLVSTLSRRMISRCVSGIDTNYIPRLCLAILPIDTHISTDCS